MTVWIIIILSVVALDQASKWLVMLFLDRGEPLTLSPGILRFTYVENTGAAFGSFGDQRWIFMIVSVIGIIALFVYLWKFRPDSKWACTALSMIIGGGIGNMIDRTCYNGSLPTTIGKKVVIDFIDFCAFPEIWPWVFNIADSFVCVGAGILIVWCMYTIVQESKELKRAKAESAAAADSSEPSDTEDK